MTKLKNLDLSGIFAGAARYNARYILLRIKKYLDCSDGSFNEVIDWIGALKSIPCIVNGLPDIDVEDEEVAVGGCAVVIEDGVNGLPVIGLS